MLNRICYFGCPKLDVKFKMPIQGCIVSKSFMFTSGTSTLLSQRKLRSLKWRNVDASTPDPWLPKPPQRLRPNQRQKLTRRQRERPRCALNIFFFGKFSFPSKVRILHEYFITNHKTPKKWSWHRMPQAKKEEVPAEEEKSKVPQPDRTEYDAKAANGDVIEGVLSVYWNQIKPVKTSFSNTSYCHPSWFLYYPIHKQNATWGNPLK